MPANNFGENLIFLISQPRAGSTMLQRMLGNHPQIHTLSEPWIMLHPLYALKEEGYWFEYDGSVAWLARKEFFRSLPNGKDDYYEAMRNMFGDLYNQTLTGSGKQFVLDKTPRYYNIIPELKQIFPKAHFIFLLRNPLSVLDSISRTWIKGSWLLLHRYKSDLLKAPKLILQGIKLTNGTGTVVHYEDLVNNPSVEIERICQNLNIDFVENIVEYGTFTDQLWLHGDKSGITHLGKPDPGNIDKWIESIKKHQAWRLASDYLSVLGYSTITRMGYSFEDINGTLYDIKPRSVRLWFTFPMSLFLNVLDLTERFSILEIRIDRVIELLRDVGLKDTVRKIIGEFKQIRSAKKEKSYIQN